MLIAVLHCPPLSPCQGMCSGCAGRKCVAREPDGDRQDSVPPLCVSGVAKPRKDQGPGSGHVQIRKPLPPNSWMPPRRRTVHVGPCWRHPLLCDHSLCWWAQAVEAQRAAAAGGTSLSWADTMKAGMAAAQLSGEVRQPPLIYSSRTHSQLTQVIRELRRTSYKCGLLLSFACCSPASLSAPLDTSLTKSCIVAWRGCKLWQTRS